MREIVELKIEETKAAAGGVAPAAPAAGLRAPPPELGIRRAAIKAA
jgi:hypothetical protein